MSKSTSKSKRHMASRLTRKSAAQQGLTLDQFKAKTFERAVGLFLDRSLNAGPQKYGFALLTFPYGVARPPINVLSNIGHRETLASLFAATNAEYGQPKPAAQEREQETTPRGEDTPANGDGPMPALQKQCKFDQCLMRDGVCDSINECYALKADRDEQANG